MNIAVITLFPDMFSSVMGESILKRAIENGLVEISLHNLRNWGSGSRKSIDDRPYGGGPGMVLRPEPVFAAVEALDPSALCRRILMTPQGRRLSHKLAAELAEEKKILILCGHYEGFDERIRTGLGFEEVSIGDYVMTGGELPAMVLIDTVIRFLPGVLGDAHSAESDSFADDLLEYPQYTRPAAFRGMAVPDVLLSGNHAQIATWRKEQALKRTRQRRNDLIAQRRRKEENKATTEQGEKE